MTEFSTTTANLMHPLGGRLVLKRAPSLTYHCQEIDIPGITGRPTQQETPLDRIPRPGDRLYREPLVLSFKVDENLVNYSEVWTWMVGAYAPDSDSQYAALVAGSRSGSGVTSDLTVTVADSSWSVGVEFRFQDAFPTALSGLRYRTTDDGVKMMEATARFEYRHFTVHVKAADGSWE